MAATLASAVGTRDDGRVVAAINDWPGGKAAARLRQWPRVLELADAAASAPFVGLTLLGSLARGEGDDVSDVDFIVFAADEAFASAWDERHRLHPRDAVCWDYPRPPGPRDVAGHRWLTADFVLFDGLIATPSGTRVAEPFHLLVGDEALERQLRKRESIDVEGAAAAEIELHEIERLFGQLKLAIRARRRDGGD